MKFYRCRECGAIMTEDELIDREICIRGEDNHEYYHRASECPFCGELSCFDELYYDEEDIPDLVMEVSDLREKLEDQKKLIKLLKKSVKINENGKVKINMSEELNKALIELIK